MNRTKSFCLAVFFLFTAVLYVMYSQIVGQAVSNAVNICLKVIIPSTYGFMIISSMIIRTDAHKLLSRPFGLISKYIFRIPYELFSVYIISCFAGYPVGIKMIYELYDSGEIDRKTAEYMSCFCFAGGPAFISGTVSVLFSDKRIALIIFLSVTAGNIITALIFGFFRKYSCDEKTDFVKCRKLSAEMITSSVESSAESMFVICAMITGFAVFSSIAECLGIIGGLADFLSMHIPLDRETLYNCFLSFMEISHITSLKSDNCNIIPVLTALFSFGGLCVTVQINALTKGRINLRKFFISRIISAVSSAVICRMITSRMNIYVSVMALEPYKLHNADYSVVPSFMLIIMTILLIKEMRTDDRIL